MFGFNNSLVFIGLVFTVRSVEKDAKHIRELMGPRIEKGNGMLILWQLRERRKKNNFGCTLT